jgi:hypothetical protein
MPTATLVFNLPEEQDDFELVNKASKYYSVIWDLDQFLRSKIKYADEHTSELSIEAFQHVRDELWNLMNEKNITLEI